ncbi:MAG TPA: nuclear transport factor 2 family protein [Ideonella sp.]|uniref:nuclear transport factor 2 family protein n=1 Tax=Ideonella sp. TaxID=1929293 RepID=UPI002E3140C4|nr:nuclear transport factor 2 family protein [Ideonella sp.]HEX5687261.1 nuclear transport factor 2 family protein [Ideonella sp.]
MPSIDVARRYIQAVQAGDHATLGALISPHIVWHQPGHHRFSGTHRGVQAVMQMLGGMMEVSQGTFRITRVHRFMANDPWVTIELEFEGRRDDALVAQPGIDLVRIEDGQIAEVRLFSSDPAQEDAFWGT